MYWTIMGRSSPISSRTTASCSGVTFLSPAKMIAGSPGTACNIRKTTSVIVTTVGIVRRRRLATYSSMSDQDDAEPGSADGTPTPHQVVIARLPRDPRVVEVRVETAPVHPDVRHGALVRKQRRRIGKEDHDLLIQRLLLSLDQQFPALLRV